MSLMTEIVSAPEHEPPFAVELVVLEEDRWRVLSARSRATPERRETETLVADMTAEELPATGDLVIRGNRAFAIVHDLEASPTTDAQSIRRCLEKLFDHCRENRIQSIAIEPLGAVHGSITVSEAVELIESFDVRPVERIWLLERAGS